MICVFVCLVLCAACTMEDTSEKTTSSTTNQDGESADGTPVTERVKMTPALCEANGGSWNECGSPCAGTNADMCIQMCAAQCECGGIAGFGCPEGYSCRLSGAVADEIGACVPD